MLDSIFHLTSWVHPPFLILFYPQVNSKGTREGSSSNSDFFQDDFWIWVNVNVNIYLDCSKMILNCILHWFINLLKLRDRHIKILHRSFEMNLNCIDTDDYETLLAILIVIVKIFTWPSFYLIVLLISWHYIKYLF